MAVSSLNTIIVSNSYLVSPITDLSKATPLLKAIIDLSKARASHYLLKDRVEPLRDDNSNKSESNFQSKEEEHDKNDDVSIIID